MTKLSCTEVPRDQSTKTTKGHERKLCTLGAYENTHYKYKGSQTIKSVNDYSNQQKNHQQIRKDNVELLKLIHLRKKNFAFSLLILITHQIVLKYYMIRM